MQTLNISFPREDRQNEPRGMERNVFRLGRGLMESDRANQRHPFPELFWMEREMPEGDIDRRANLWQSYNAAANNIRGARILTQAAANHLVETQLMLTLVQTMLDDAIESNNVDFRSEIAGRVVDMLHNIDDSFAGLARVFDRSSAVQVSSADSDSFVVQVGIHSGGTHEGVTQAHTHTRDEGQTRTVVIRQINTQTLGFADADGNINTQVTLEDMRDRVAEALSELRYERTRIHGVNSALDADRSILDLNVWGNSAVQPGTINPPLDDDATVEEQMRRTEAERAMRMSILRREATNLRTLFEMIELFRD